MPHFFYSSPEKNPFEECFGYTIKQRVIYIEHGKHNLEQ
jgi:hypothetical protein